MPSLFAEHGLRCTRQRRALYQVLAASKDHPTADDLHRRLNVIATGMSLATVYNTLEAFCNAGLAQRLPGAGNNGSARFDATNYEHLHARDLATGNVADVPEHLSQRILEAIPPHLLEEIEDHLGFEIDQLQIELLGEFRDS